MKAYLSIYTEQNEGYKTAKEIATKYIAYPVLFWRNMFVEIANQLAEIDNTEKCEVFPYEDVIKTKDNLVSAEQEEFIEIEKENNSLKIRFKNSSLISVKYFKTDLEVLFSKNPFLNHDSKNFSMVSPFVQEDLQVEKRPEINEQQILIPESISKSNLYIQVTTGSMRKTITHFPTGLTVQIKENYGLLSVIDTKTKKLLPKVYVKCFSKTHSGKVNFYKDGYTDIRGSFDFSR